MHARHLVPAFLLLAACASSPDARRYDGFDGYARPIPTDDPEVQAWFDHGLQLLYGFNHDEAMRSFRAALDLEPRTPMAWWALSYANGLDINNPEIKPSEAEEAYRASRTAMSMIDDASPVAQALIRAVHARYEAENPMDRRHLDEAYAEKMGEAFRAFPDDPDVATLYAESLMNLQPWDYWAPDGAPKGRIEEIVSVLEGVLAAHPNHPGANHFYIHAVEASSEPERGVPAADRLRTLVPGSGHLVHMPSHIDIRVGRFDDAIAANEAAIAADKRYFALAPPPDFYSLYYVHNIHFLGFAAMMSGRQELAMASARQIEAEIPPAFVENAIAFADGFLAMPYHVMVRFGDWEGILNEPEPPPMRVLSRAVRHYARGIAHAARGEVEAARLEQAAFRERTGEVPEGWSMGINPAADVLAVADAMLEGEILYRERKLEEAYVSLRHARDLETGLTYDEPPGWMVPTRHALGALLYGGGRYEEALDVYREDLRKHPNNGWSLIGLERSLLALGRRDEAADVGRAREAAWANADVQPTSSCYCEPGVTSR